MASALLLLIASHEVCTARLVMDTCRSDSLELELATDSAIDADTEAW